MKISRTIATGIAVLATSALLVGCSEDEPESTSSDSSSQADDTASAEETASADDGAASEDAGGEEPSLAGGGEATVTVDGKAIDGFGEVQCVEQGDSITFATTASTDPTMAGTLSEGGAKVESLAITSGTLSMVVSTVGASLGSAEVAVDGDAYTITGTAVGTDTEDLSSQTESDIEVAFSC